MYLDDARLSCEVGLHLVGIDPLRNGIEHEVHRRPEKPPRRSRRPDRVVFATGQLSSFGLDTRGRSGRWPFRHRRLSGATQAIGISIFRREPSVANRSQMSARHANRARTGTADRGGRVSDG